MLAPTASLGDSFSSFFDAVGSFFSNLAAVSWPALFLALLFFLAYNGYQVVRGITDSGSVQAYVNAESIIGLYKTELVRNRGPWRGLDDLELATLEWVDWFNTRRLFEDHGRIPPAEFEALSPPRDETITPTMIKLETT